jgi:hypothetical protein
MRLVTDVPLPPRGTARLALPHAAVSLIVMTTLARSIPSIGHETRQPRGYADEPGIPGVRGHRYDGPALVTHPRELASPAADPATMVRQPCEPAHTAFAGRILS